MDWKQLNNENQLEEIKLNSSEKPILIFKHSTSCSVSAMALNRLEREWKSESGERLTPYYLDLISFRNISNKIAGDFGIEHQSPQVLLIQNGKCVYSESHYGISLSEVLNKTN